MPKPPTIEKFRKVIFDDCQELELTESEERQLLRIRAIYTLQLSKPNTPNTEIVAMLQREHGIKSVAQAYRDIAQVNSLLGSVPNASKQWMRYMVIEGLKESVEMANRIITNCTEIQYDECGIASYASIAPEVVVRAIDARTKALDKLAKYSRLDQSDPDPIPYEDIVPLPIEFTNNPEIVTGVKVANPEELVKRVKKKYIEDINCDVIE